VASVEDGRVCSPSDQIHLDLLSVIGNLLAHPLIRGLSVDDPVTTLLHCQIIERKQFLCNFYNEDDSTHNFRYGCNEGCCSSFTMIIEAKIA